MRGRLFRVVWRYALSAVHVFRLIAIAFSILLGLGVTRVLTSLVGVFLARLEARVRWIPVAWASMVFVLQLQFWWAIAELEELVDPWTRVHFVALAVIPLSLFVAAALLLPSPVQKGLDLKDWFEAHGRWGLVALSAYAVAAMAINLAFFGISFASWSMLVLGAEAALPLAYLAITEPRARASITVAYVLVVLGASWALSPANYAS
jgi:hypothetical protein